MVFGQLKEGANGDPVAVGPETVVVLTVTFLLVIGGIETAEAVVIGAAGLTQGIGKGEADAEPVAVICREVYAGDLNALGDGFGEGDWGWSSHFWKKLSFSIGRDVFGVDVGLGIVGQEAGTRDVLAFLVRLEAVGGLDVVAHGTEDVLVEVSVCADGDDPFDAVAGGACEKEGRGEFPVTEEHFTAHRHVGDVVEVQAEEVRGELDVGVAAGGEGAAEGDVVEVLGLETGSLGLIRNGAEARRLFLGVVALQVTVNYNEGDVLEGYSVTDGTLEE